MWWEIDARSLEQSRRIFHFRAQRDFIARRKVEKSRFSELAVLATWAQNVAPIGIPSVILISRERCHQSGCGGGCVRCPWGSQVHRSLAPGLKFHPRASWIIPLRTTRDHTLTQDISKAEVMDRKTRKVMRVNVGRHTRVVAEPRPFESGRWNLV